MTDEMPALANQNKRRSGLKNVEFIKGEIEHIPWPDNPTASSIFPLTGVYGVNSVR